MLVAWLTGVVVVVAAVVLLWAASVRLRDVSIIDSFWSLGFVLSAWIYHFHGPQAGPARWLHLALVTVWGLRLAAHIAWRHYRAGEEDSRYRKMRDKAGDSFWWRSLFTVFLLQGALIAAIAPPLLLTQAGSRPEGWVWSDFVGIGLWLVGFFFEAVGDAQLTRFKADPANRGKVLDTGLWAYTRHPNYFGDAVVWWSFFFFALGSDGGVYTLASTLLMTFLLLKVSGVALLEKTITERRPAYRDYIRRTSAFVPWFPKPKAQGDRE